MSKPMKKNETEELLSESVFNEDFVYELFKAALTKRDFLEILLENCESNYFPTEDFVILFEEIKTQYKVENKLPTVGTLKLHFRKNRGILKILTEIKQMDPVEHETMVLQLNAFVKNCMFIDIYSKSGEEWDKGNKKKAFDLFTKGAEKIANFSIFNQDWERVYGNFNGRQSDRITESNKNTKNIKIPTGIDELDQFLNGGPETGELWMYLAESKGGKSFALTHHGIHSSRLGYGVAHIQAEGTRAQCMNRYDANWSGSLFHDIKQGVFNEKKYKAYQKIVSTLGRADVHVHAPESFNALNMIQIRQRVIDLKKEFDIRVVIIDYLDLINPDFQQYKLGDERHRQQMTAQKMKELAMEQDVLVLTATQANSVDRESIDDPEFVLTRENLAEGKGKVRPVDGLLTLNRTRDEKKEGICRIYLEAVREHGGGDVVTIKQNLARSRFYDRSATIKMFGALEEE